MDSFDGWFLRTDFVYVQVCHALLWVACQNAAPHNMAEYSKTSQSPNPPWLALPLQPLLRYSIGPLIKHKHLWASNWGRIKYLHACAWSFGLSVSQSGAIFTARNLAGISVVIATPDLMSSLCFTSLPLCLSLILLLVSSLRKTPSLPGPECKCFIFHPPTNPLCSTGHLAVIFQHLKVIIPKYECSLTDVARHSRDIFLPSSSPLPHGQKQKEEKSRCLVSVHQHT